MGDSPQQAHIKMLLKINANYVIFRRQCNDIDWLNHHTQDYDVKGCFRQLKPKTDFLRYNDNTINNWFLPIANHPQAMK